MSVKMRFSYLDVITILSSCLVLAQAFDKIGSWQDIKNTQLRLGVGPAQCSKAEPCTDGSCCNSKGQCGFGPEHCSPNAPDICLSNCNATAMCGRYSRDGKTSCPLNTCCSYFGWCGTDEAHCVNGDPKGHTEPCQPGFGSCTVVPPPSCGVNSNTAVNGRRIAYYQSYTAQAHRKCNIILPDKINTSGLSHLYYAFATIDPKSFEVQPPGVVDELIIKRFTGLQKPGVLETWVSIGGFDFSNPGTPTATTWSDMVSSSANRAKFITSLIDFMSFWGFQGADLDWEYPGVSERGGRQEDSQNFVNLVKEMRTAFGTKYGISTIIAPDIWYQKGMDPKAMEPYVDWFGFMAYDLHGFWDANVKTLGAKIESQTDIREIMSGTLPLWFNHTTPSKINLGLAAYGRGYTVASTKCMYPGCAFTGPSKPGKCTDFAGVMSNHEIQELIKSQNLVPELLKDPAVKQITFGDQWIGYDDEETWRMKTSLANDLCMGGTMVWSIDMDFGPGTGDNPTSTTTTTTKPSTTSHPPTPVPTPDCYAAHTYVISSVCSGQHGLGLQIYKNGNKICDASYNFGGTQSSNDAPVMDCGGGTSARSTANGRILWYTDRNRNEMRLPTPDSLFHMHTDDCDPGFDPGELKLRYTEWETVFGTVDACQARKCPIPTVDNCQFENTCDFDWACH